MSRRGVLTALVASTLVMSAAVGCSSDKSSATSSSSPTDPCTSVVRDLLATTQRYVDGFGIDTQPRVSASASPSPTPTRQPASVSEQQYADAITAARGRLAAVRCDNARFQDAMSAGLQSIRSHGAIATAVLAQLRISLAGRLPTNPVTRTAGPHDDIANLLASLPDRSTLVLARGTYRLPDTLVLLRSITVRGAGKDATVLTSGAPDAAVLVMTAAAVNFTQLGIRRTGSTPGSVVMTGPSARLTLRGVHVSGALADSQGAGGVGVLLTATNAPVTNPAVTFTAIGSAFTDNATAGVAAGGTHGIAISGSVFTRNRQCGVCYLGSSSGTISANTFTDNAVGVVLASASRSVVRGNRFIGGDVGIQATGEAKPAVSDNTIKGTARASIVFVGDAAGTIDGNDCSGDRAGIAVARTAYPYVGTNACRVTLGQ